MQGMTAGQIDVSKLNAAMKGVRVRVHPLHDIYDEGKQNGFGLNMQMPGEKKFSRTKYAPFFFTDEAEAEKAAGIINAWSVTPNVSYPSPNKTD